MKSCRIGLPRSVALVASAWAEPAPGSRASPFPDALAAAAISQDRLDGIHENSLILDNGDSNGLPYSSGGSLILRITKNDMWKGEYES